MKFSSMFWRQTGAVLLGLCVVLIYLMAGGETVIAPPVSQAAVPKEIDVSPNENVNLPTLQTAVSLPDTLPLDVDLDALSNLNFETQLPEAQRIFDEFAWQMFIALNWPANPDGTPDTTASIADIELPRVWEYYRETSTVFLEDGSAPAPWDPAQATPGLRSLSQTSKILNVNHPTGQLLDESLQAFTGPLIDQNGNWAYYEVLMNETEFNYVLENELYNQEGQVAFTADNIIDFPANTEDTPGSIELKFAWKILADNDIPDRFFTIEADIAVPQYDADGNRLAPLVQTELVGLVGMHIAVRTESAPEWIWATFEQVDNVQANSLETGTAINGDEVRLKPNFNNPDTPVKAINTLPPKNALPGPVIDANGQVATGFTGWDPAKTTDPTQLLRVVPIPKETQALNAEVQAELAAEDSVFQYYELIGTQWPVNPKFPAFPGGVIHYPGSNPNGETSSPESLIYKSPGKMVPVLLTNMTMESFFQQGNQVPGGPERDDRLPASTGNAVQDPTGLIFYTESCVGCHYSAGAAIGFKVDESGELMRDSDGCKIPFYGENSNMGQTGNAHFSWLLQMKARQNEPCQPQ